ncbi:hypothetical protein C1878_09085 [Gordonibacter sp. 28C]|uniref:hypothetical protein n=1 Tax=Gordonibacter sp. 28C TaxID=2078569 RepID=UPI000DF7E2B6|nr:hypothetical protein [Gordonibacter sp. 28C]RDB61965.1 hypothetical protein C1878_09085 [Gordonibacter sp. 28C]
MNEDPLNRYQSMMSDTHAPAHLSEQVLEQARAQTSETLQPAKVDSPHTQAAVTAFSVKRTRVKGFAIAACTVLALGLGGTALALGLPGLAGNGDAPVAANSFQLAAFADEGAEPSNGPVTLSSEDFAPSRTSAGPFYDRETDSYPGPIVASRAYNLDLTCSGDNIASITYELQGEGVSFNNWQLTPEYLESNGEVEVGTTVATADQDSTFTVDYDDQDTKAPDSVHHELFFNYTLDEDEMAVWDEFQASTARPRVPRDSATDEEIAAWNEAFNKFELVLGQHDAKIIAQARIAITATFKDGTTATKTYRLTPVDNFEQAYSEYLAVRSSPDGATAPNRSILYTLDEVTG